jgi:hypothetical protein
VKSSHRTEVLLLQAAESEQESATEQQQSSAKGSWVTVRALHTTGDLRRNSTACLHQTKQFNKFICSAIAS